MTKTEYRKARRMVRNDGYRALEVLPTQQSNVMYRLLKMQRTEDPLADREQIISNMGWGITLAKSLARHLRATHDAQRAFA